MSDVPAVRDVGRLVVGPDAIRFRRDTSLVPLALLPVFLGAALGAALALVAALSVALDLPFWQAVPGATYAAATITASLAYTSALAFHRWRSSGEFWLTAHGVQLRTGFVPYDDVRSAGVRPDGGLRFERLDGSVVDGPALTSDEASVIVPFVVRHLEAREPGRLPAALGALRAAHRSGTSA